MTYSQVADQSKFAFARYGVPEMRTNRGVWLYATICTGDLANNLYGVLDFGRRLKTYKFRNSVVWIRSRTREPFEPPGKMLLPGTMFVRLKMLITIANCGLRLAAVNAVVAVKNTQQRI